MIIQQLKTLRSLTGKAAKNGFFHILIGNSLVKALAMFPGLLLPIILSVTSYAQISFADTIITYLLLFSGLGISGGVLRYCAIAENDSETKTYFEFGLRFGVGVNLVLATGALAVFCYTSLVSRPYNSICAALVLTPLFAFTLEAIQYFLRATKENRIYARLSVVFAACMSALQLILAFFFNINGVVAGRYLSYGVTILCAALLIRRLGPTRSKSQRLMTRQKLDIIKYSFFSMLANCFSQIIANNEQFIVNKVIGSDKAIAAYKFAATLPAALQFIAVSVIVFVFPYFAKHYRDGDWILRNTFKLIAAMTAVTAVFTVFAVIFTPQIIFVYSKKYLEIPGTVHVMRLLWVTFGVASCLRIPLGNILAAIGEIRFNTLNNAVSMVVHVIIGYLMVKHFGINGAAYGLMIIYTLSSVAALIFLVYYCKNLEKKRLSGAEGG
ncbi:MAG: oligosaccharide flippase family protein [Clostridia bacterium]|nr:oligosaccharide flippase family protein [Clostridia bacterium]MDR3645548.1 oligosaccharide flippase family protein [Clostridia bacterium]